MDIITREEAQAQVLKRFYTGKPCRNGHLSERLTNGTACLECERIRMRQNLANNRDAINFRRRKKYANDAKHRATELARGAKRRSWVCTDDMENPEAIEAIYTDRDHVSEFLGMTMHVDHIIPVHRGGAHHEDNLQIITATQNLSKGARIDWEPEPNVYEQVAYYTTRGN